MVEVRSAPAFTFTDEAKSALSPSAVRQACRDNTFTIAGTSGYSEGFTHVNVVALPSRYAEDFRTLCQRNPVPCPLLGETKVGDPAVPEHLARIAADVRTDCRFFKVYRNGELVADKNDILDEWTDDHVAFFIGCSHTFEHALLSNGFRLRHVDMGLVVPMYQTTVPLMSAGVFKGNMVVSMRPYKRSDIPRIIEVTRKFSLAHGEPVAYGPEGAARLGITDLTGTKPDWGGSIRIEEDEVPVFWACGVTPQLVVMNSGIEGTVMAHKPGHMLVTDLPDEEVCL